MGTVFDLQHPAYLRGAMGSLDDDDDDDDDDDVVGEWRRRARNGDEASKNGRTPTREASTISTASAMGSDGGGSLLKLQRRESLCMRMLPYIIQPDGAIGSTKWLDGRGDDDSFCNAAVS